MQKRFNSIIIMVSFIFTTLSSFVIPSTSSSIPKWLSESNTNLFSSVNNEQAVALLLNQMGFQSKLSAKYKAIYDVSKKAPSSWAAPYIAYADSNGFLPEQIPNFNSVISKNTLTRLFLAINNYKVWPEKSSDQDTAAAVNSMIQSVASRSGITSLNSSATKNDVFKLLKTYKFKSVGWYTMISGWDNYSKKNFNVSKLIFQNCINAGLNAGTTNSYYANANYGLGAVYSHASQRYYYTASTYLKAAISYGKGSAIANSASKLLNKLEPFQLGLDYMPSKDMTYEEFIALLWHQLYFNSGWVPNSFKVLDKSGHTPAKWAEKYVSYCAYKNIFPNMPNKFTDPVPRYWAAAFLAKLNFFENTDYDKYYAFNDLTNVTSIDADTKMFINIALDRGLFPMPSSQTFNTYGHVKRNEISAFIKGLKNQKKPTTMTFTKQDYKKEIDAYYCDNGNSHFTEQNNIIQKYGNNVNGLMFSQVYFDPEDSYHDKDFTSPYYKNEGTKYLRSRFELTKEISQGLSIAQSKGIKRYLTLVGKDKATASMIKDDSIRKDVINDTMILIKRYNFDGVHIDFEGMDPSLRDTFSQFIKELSEKLKPENKILSVAVGSYTSDYYECKGPYDYSKLGQYSDYVNVIAYDDFSVNSYPRTKQDGPISRLNRNEKVLKYAVLKIPSKKILLGIGAYAIDFNISDKKTAKLLSLMDVENTANSGIKSSKKYGFDDSTKSPYITYTDSSNQNHKIWYENSKSLSSRMQEVNKYKLGGIFYYWLGSESQDLYDSINNYLK